MKAIIAMLFGASWKTSLAGLATGIALGVVTYAQSRSEPGWYVVAIGFAWFGRVAKDWDKSNAAVPVPESVKVP
jgi:hypothetical protein